MEHDNSDSPVMQIPLTYGQVTIVDIVDADLAQYQWRAAASRGLFYAQRTPPREKVVILHRVILERMLGRPLAKGEMPDHINRDPLDNRRSNLRLATPSQNSRNRRANSNSKSGYKGVYPAINSTWDARIFVDGKSILLGRFADVKEAARAYNAAAIEHFKEFAWLNPIPDDDTPPQY